MAERTWWNREHRPFDMAELVADGVVHAVGIIFALVAGSVLMTLAAFHVDVPQLVALGIYVVSLVIVLSVSLAYNLWPVTPTKMLLARCDQAAIFLFIAGTYTPFLTFLSGTTAGNLMTALVWGASLVGIALKLIIPEKFGRLAIALYLAIGWSGVLVFQTLASTLSPTALGLIVAGGIVYSLGVIFHLWEKLRFQNALWHVFVVIGATLHLAAVLDCMVISRA